MNKIITVYLLSMFVASSLVAQDVPNRIIPAGGKNLSLPFQILTIGEPVVSGAGDLFMGFGFSHTVSPFLVLSQVKTDLDPNILNLKSQGRFVTIFFEITGVKNTNQIVPASMAITRINDQVVTSLYAEPKPLSLEDQNQDGILELMVKFNRQSLIDVLPVAEQVKITLEGILVDQSPFKVDGFLRTIQPGAIPSHNGGVVFHPSGAKMEVPIEALPEGGELYIVKLSEAPPEDTNLRKKAGNSLKLHLVGVPYEFGPEGKRFSASIMIVIPYDPLTLPQGTEGKFQIAYWNPETKTWELLDSTVDEIKKVVRAQTTHFSLYQIVSSMESQPDTDFNLGEVYVFPNPSRSGTKPTFHIEVGVADIVHIWIYTISGEFAHEITLIGTPQIIDDGQGPQYAYESAWEGYIPSGIYLYVLTAERGGERIKKTGKFVVVR
ncbi:MAG: hypothetical protein HY746_02235 [Elusimicrobia bacterium]|nr:hypothetical protein [Elusimicrobiota bacterium]